MLDLEWDRTDGHSEMYCALCNNTTSRHEMVLINHNLLPSPWLCQSCAEAVATAISFKPEEVGNAYEIFKDAITRRPSDFLDDFRVLYAEYEGKEPEDDSDEFVLNWMLKWARSVDLVREYRDIYDWPEAI